MSEEKKDDNVIYVGQKPALAYATATVIQLGKNEKVYVKARGRSISKAVDVAEIVRNKFMKETKLGAISIGTEQKEVTSEKGEKYNVNISNISIELSK